MSGAARGDRQQKLQGSVHVKRDVMRNSVSSIKAIELQLRKFQKELAHRQNDLAMARAAKERKASDVHFQQMMTMIRRIPMTTAFDKHGIMGGKA